MSWREERDALIAQTLAFVQSVTGKPADFSQLAPPPSAPKPSERRPEPAVEVAAITSGHDGHAEPDPAEPIPPSAPSSSNAPAAPEPPPAAPPESITGHPFTSIAAQLGLQRDMQTEIRARVANFRANQERFNRERQEYFSSTLERLRAWKKDVRDTDK